MFIRMSMRRLVGSTIPLTFSVVNPFSFFECEWLIARKGLMFLRMSMRRFVRHKSLSLCRSRPYYDDGKD